MWMEVFLFVKIMDVLNKIKPIIADTLGIPVDTVSDNLAIGDIEQWDSMGNMAIISALEESLGIEFPLEDLFELNSVDSIVEEIKKLTL